MALAATTAQAPICTPQASHSAVPSVNTPYIAVEMPDTSRVRSVSQACGTND